MDFSQNKLTKAEWESIEVRLPENELEILKLVYDGYDNVTISYNKNNSLYETLKLGTADVDTMHCHLYEVYFQQSINELSKKYKLEYKTPKLSKKKAIKKIDKMRIENMDSRLTDIRSTLYEYVILTLTNDLCKQIKRNKIAEYYKTYYTLRQLSVKQIINANVYVIEFVKFVLDTYSSKTNDLSYYLYHAYDIIEQNTTLHAYENMQLYEHQRELFSCTKVDEPKIVLYQAPTGTGKTISPIGLSKQRKVIFVCAAKHVGLQLAKACVNMEIPLAIAFGCKDPGDIRLHYNAAKEIVKNFKTGGIFRVDNTVGDKVQIIVTDVQSYIPAMNYMTAFNKPQDIITYWDEPTISLDYETHEFHSILQTNWKDNIIPNMVLSSATLPSMEEIQCVIQNFKAKFDGCNVFNIVSHDCKKTIPILDSDNNICLPHLLYTEKKALQGCVKHCKSYKTLMRHFDIEEIGKFIEYVVTKNLITKDRYTINEYFDSLFDITLISIKQYYLDVLKHVAKDWETHGGVYKALQRPREASTIKLTTSDAHTLTHGPSIYITNQVDLIAKYCLKLAQIPTEEMDTIMKHLEYNDTVMSKIHSVEKDLKEFTDRVTGSSCDKDEKDTLSKSNAGVIQDFNRTIYGLKSKLKPIHLPYKYVPNTIEHLKRFDKSHVTNAFTSSIDDVTMEKILMTSVSTIWKMLLMLGIGIFKEFDDIEYLEIMKKLANDQKLFMIIASSDYIYGTNYQFCHEYIGKDIIGSMTQEKAIQAFGRVGRQSTQQNYSIRLRDNALIDKIFNEDKNKMEVKTMNRLFA